MNFRERETLLAKERVKQLESNIDLNSPNFYDYQKKNEFKTIFDDKKILEKKQHFKSPPDAVSRGNGLSSSNNKNGIITDILPTTSAAYGVYYNNDNRKKFFY